MATFSNPALLFIYGTLHPDHAPRAIAHAARRLKPIGPATIHGRLLDLGEYPGLLLENAAGSAPKVADDASRRVLGEVFEVPDATALAELDAYEGFRSGDPAASLFLRVEAPVTMKDGRALRCWVYVYNCG